MRIKVRTIHKGIQCRIGWLFRYCQSSSPEAGTGTGHAVKVARCLFTVALAVFYGAGWCADTPETASVAPRLSCEAGKCVVLVDYAGMVAGDDGEVATVDCRATVELHEGLGAHLTREYREVGHALVTGGMARKTLSISIPTPPSISTVKVREVYCRGRAG